MRNDIQYQSKTYERDHDADQFVDPFQPSRSKYFIILELLTDSVTAQSENINVLVCAVKALEW